MKNYNTAPLPFMGQKRRFLNDFKTALKDYPEGGTYVDLFGGSGLLSHTVKTLYPAAKVVYNDFDNYTQRLQTIPSTNQLLADIREIVKGVGKEKRIEGAVRAAVLERIGAEEGFVDYITLSSSLLFSMNYVTDYAGLTKSTLYNVVKQSDYSAAGYLDGVEVVSCDYKKLYEQFRGDSSVVFLVDPPYLSTESGTYKNYWRLSDYLDVLDVLEGGNYFYFTSNKSHIVELCRWVSTRTGWASPFSGSSTATANIQMNYSSSYTDIMISKK